MMLIQCFTKQAKVVFFLGSVPLWIEKKSYVDDIKVLDFITKSKFFPSPDEICQNEVKYAILISPTKECEHLVNWCKLHAGWKVVKYSDVTGSEFPYVVAIVEDDRINLEVFSRAQQGLIIVTM